MTYPILIPYNILESFAIRIYYILIFCERSYLYFCFFLKMTLINWTIDRRCSLEVAHQNTPSKCCVLYWPLCVGISSRIEELNWQFTVPVVPDILSHNNNYTVIKKYTYLYYLCEYVFYNFVHFCLYLFIYHSFNNLNKKNLSY